MIVRESVHAGLSMCQYACACVFVIDFVCACVCARVCVHVSVIENCLVSFPCDRSVGAVSFAPKNYS